MSGSPHTKQRADSVMPVSRWRRAATGCGDGSGLPLGPPEWLSAFPARGGLLRGPSGQLPTHGVQQLRLMRMKSTMDEFCMRNCSMSPTEVMGSGMHRKAVWPGFHVGASAGTTVVLAMTGKL